MFSLLILCIAHAKAVPPKMYFKTTTEGIFSMFLQAKILNVVAQFVGYKAMIVPLERSQHFKSIVVDLCSIFELPDSIGCGFPPSEVNSNCLYDFKLLPLVNHTDVCYYSKNYIGGARFLIEHRMNWPDTMRSAVNIDGMPMVLQPQHHAVADLFRMAIGITKPPPFSSSTAAGSSDLTIKLPRQSYTAVHWRRGDQLTARCGDGGPKAQDHTINCGTAEDLIQHVKRITKDSIVYVATNEERDSLAHETLRKAGFITYVSLAESWPNDEIKKVEPLQVLAVEAILMKEADTFLGWGYTEINDVIEFERRNDNQTFCLDQEGIEDDSWCSVYGLKEDRTYTVNFDQQVMGQYCKVFPKEC